MSQALSEQASFGLPYPQSRSLITHSWCPGPWCCTGLRAVATGMASSQHYMAEPGYTEEAWRLRKPLSRTFEVQKSPFTDCNVYSSPQFQLQEAPSPTPGPVVLWRSFGTVPVPPEWPWFFLLPGALQVTSQGPLALQVGSTALNMRLPSPDSSLDAGSHSQELYCCHPQAPGPKMLRRLQRDVSCLSLRSRKSV